MQLYEISVRIETFSQDRSIIYVFKSIAFKNLPLGKLKSGHRSYQKKMYLFLNTNS